MRKYSLLLAEDRSAESRRIEFDAIDASAALKLAEHHGLEQPMELWEDDRMLGTIRSVSGFWSLSKT